MQEAVKTIAVVRGAADADVQALFRAFVNRWRGSARIAGVIEDSRGFGGPACGEGHMQSIASGACFRMFQDLGPGSTGCRIDPAGVLLAGEAVRRDIAAGCDLVLLNRFAKLEAGREGLIAAFSDAVEAELPVLTSVTPDYQEAWERFASPLFVMLPPDRQALDEWWRAVRARALSPAGQ